MTDQSRYSLAQRVIHWLTLVLFLASFVSHEAMKDAWRVVRQGATEFTPDVGVRVHVIVGIVILGLSVLRIILRLTKGAPAQPAGQSRLITVAAAAVHGLLYLVILALPLSGMGAWFGMITDLGEVHEVLFNLGLVLLAAHVGAALLHQFVIKDNLIRRMW